MTFNESIDRHIREAQKLLIGAGVRRKDATKERALELIINMNKAAGLTGFRRKRKSKNRLIVEI